jgi:hypothetical protein
MSIKGGDSMSVKKELEKYFETKKQRHIHQIQFKIWCINETVLHLGDMFYKSNDEQHKTIITKKIERFEREKQTLYNKWEDIEQMKHFYEVSKDHELIAFYDLDEAIDYADKNGCTIISEIGGAWEEFAKCSFCGEWFTASELNLQGDCSRCECALRDHDGGNY